MATSTFYGLEIAKTGLFTARNEMEVTGHNISNVDTVGYTRQRLTTAAIPAPDYNTLIAQNDNSQVGMGVQPLVVDQIRNPFLDYQYREANTIEVMWQTKEQYFGYVEALFNNELDDMEYSTGFSTMLDKFYSSLYDMANGSTPDIELRTNVQQNAIVLTDTLNYYYDRLLQQQTTLNSTVAATVTQVNTIIYDIVELNEKIFGYELSGSKANDLRDQRNLLLDELSGLIDMTYSETVDGHLTVVIDGEKVVDHTEYMQLDVLTVEGNNNIKGDEVPDLFEVVWQDPSGQPTDDFVYITGGALKGFLDVRDGNSEDDYGIPQITNLLAELSQKIVMEVNKIHRSGYTMPYEDSGSETGIDFFYQPNRNDFIDGAVKDGIPHAVASAMTDDELYYEGNPAWEQISAGNIRVSDAVKESPYNIATSDVKIVLGNDNEERGNNLIALQLSQLLTRTDESGNPDNFDSMYQIIVTGVGINQDTISKLREAQTVVAAQIEMQRMSVSGVSLDEEMSNLIRYEHAYNAASRVITAVDEQLDTIINKMGLVGR